MNFVTTIGVNSSVQSIDKLLQHLRSSNIDVEGPLPDQLKLNDTDLPAAEYQVKLMLFQSIGHSSFHIIDNPDGVITQDLALQIIYAMFKQRPVMIAVAPSFSPEVEHGLRRIIESHMERFIVLDVNVASNDELAQVAATIPERVDYELTDQEQQLIKYRSKAYFRDLLQR